MQNLLYIVGNIIIVIGFIFLFFGVVAMFRFKDFYSRILAVSKIDTMGALTIIIGMSLRHGISPFTGKIIFIAIILLLFNPLVSHILARSAYISGHIKSPEIDSEKEREQD